MLSPTTVRYGPHPSQFAELTRPAGEVRAGAVVIIHGGFWRARYGLELARPLAADLAARGWTCWNLEYRRVGDGGGWPFTFEDIGAGIDRLTELRADSGALVAVGHSAGGHLAVWAAGRRGGRVPLRAVVSQAGVLDLGTAARTGVGGTAVSDLLGGAPPERARRYAAADPLAQVPLNAPVLCVHSRDDANVPFAQSEAYVAASTAAGGSALVREVGGDHMSLIDVSSAGWRVVRDALPELMAGRLPATPGG